MNYTSSRPRRASKKLPRHSRRHLKLPVMVGKNWHCLHSLSRHEDIVADGKQLTISYALPCTKTKKHTEHKDAYGRTWH